MDPGCHEPCHHTLVSLLCPGQQHLPPVSHDQKVQLARPSQVSLQVASLSPLEFAVASLRSLRVRPGSATRSCLGWRLESPEGTKGTLYSKTSRHRTWTRERSCSPNITAGRSSLLLGSLEGCAEEWLIHANGCSNTRGYYY